MTFDYDLIVIGSGPAGIACAMQSSKFDKKVLVIERKSDSLGGAWINTGTVPSKSMMQAAKTIYRFQTQFGDEKGRRPFEKFRMEDLLQYQQSVLDERNKKVKEDLIKNEIDTLAGTGRLSGPNSVEVKLNEGGTREIKAEKILISTGSSPRPFADAEKTDVEILDYETILELTHIPRKLVIIGGGINAFEYASIFGSLGTRVSILNQKTDYLVFLDHEIKEHFKLSFGKHQISVRNGVSIDEIRKNDLRNCTEVCFRTEQEERLQVIETEHVLTLGGYTPNTSQIGLESAGVEVDEEQYIIVDKNYKTSTDSIYAAGDVVGKPKLASVSFVQGRLAACDMFGIPAKEVPDEIPYAIYTIPEVASIGLTEKQANEKGLDITVGRAYYKNVTQAEISNLTDGLLKLVFSTSDLKLLGVHIIGEEANDLIHLGQSVMSYGGDIRYFIQHVINYPSYTEAYRIAAFNGVNRVYKAGVKYKKILENKLESSSDQT